MKRQQTTVIMVTHTPDGDNYGTLSGQAVSERKTLDLFVKPNDDGLFPGFTQTWQQLAPRRRHK